MSNWSTSNSTYGNSYTRSSLLSSPQKRTIRLNSPSRNGSSPMGLSNLGNTCYISAVMQVLFEIISGTDLPISKKAQQLTAQFFTLKKSRDRDDYKEFKSMLEDRIEIVRGWEQQDAHELLIEFIEQLRQENS
jgi:ubiquitin C-terminal hydrolase